VIVDVFKTLLTAFPKGREPLLLFRMRVFFHQVADRGEKYFFDDAGLL
jgi:hypothetical protein